MYSVLIVEPTEDIRIALTSLLKNDYNVVSSENGNDGLNILNNQKFDALIINLSLEEMDGIYFLESVSCTLPRAIIALSYIYTPYILQSMKDLGNVYPVQLPCSFQVVKRRLDSMLNTKNTDVPMDRQNIITSHLHVLNLPNWSGFQMLRVGIPLFWQDRSQPLTKELYPAITEICNYGNSVAVEKAIRDCIHHAWLHRDDKIWKQYFTDTSRCPSNKDFLYRLSEFLDK